MRFDGDIVARSVNSVKTGWRIFIYGVFMERRVFRRWVFVSLRAVVRCSVCRVFHRYVWFRENRFVCVHCWDTWSVSGGR